MGAVMVPRSAMVVPFVLASLLAMVRAGDVTNNGCPQYFERYADSCYAYMQSELSWSDAEQTCAAIHAHLVEVFTPGEVDFVYHMAVRNGNDEVWLGAHDLVHEGAWSWAWSGSNFEVKN